MNIKVAAYTVSEKSSNIDMYASEHAMVFIYHLFVTKALRCVLEQDT